MNDLRFKSAPGIDTGQTVPLDFKFVASESNESTIEGYGSVFGNVDLGGDMILPGAFAKSIKSKGAAGVKLLWQHDSHQPIGIWDDLTEDGKGLKCKGRILTDLRMGKEASILAKNGIVSGLSIGYRTTRANYDKDGNRVIAEAELWEVSMVTFPMNPKAVVTSVKAEPTLPTEREIEKALRDVGLSQEQRRKAVAAFKGLLRDVEGTGEQHRDDADSSAIAREIAFMASCFTS